MISIAKKKVDARPILGAVVVFLIIGAIVFGIYYFAIASPAAGALVAAKASALSQVNSLSSLGTSQASSSASSFSARIQAAGSTAEVDSITVEVSNAIQLEQARKTLLGTVSTATNGIYYTTTGASDTTQVQALTDLASTLQAGVNAKTSLNDLDSYQSYVNTQATSTWRTALTTIINQIITDNRLSMTVGSPPNAYGSFISKENAVIYVDNADLTWQELRTLKFEDATVQVPVKDTFERTPTLKEGSIVRVYIYDEDTENLALKFTNAVVKNVIYSQSDLGTISWTITSTSGATTTTSSYSTNIWETIKAAAAGNADAIAVGWQDYGEDAMTRALSANVGSYTLQVIYVIEVSDPIGEEVAKAEFQLTSTQDVILLPVV